MNLQIYTAKWKKFANDCNSRGIPLPLARDPKTNAGSVSLTMMLISFVMVLIGLIGKYSKMLEGVDVSQSLNLFIATSALYFGRKLTRDAKGSVVEAASNETPKTENKDS